MSLAQAVHASMLHAPRETAPGIFAADFVFAQDFAGFSGHFPGNPILPGIAQIMAAVMTANAASSGEGNALSLREVRRAKFLRTVHPGEQVRVRAEIKPDCDADGLLVTARLEVQGEDCAHLIVLLCKEAS